MVYLGASEIFFQNHDLPVQINPRPYILYVGPRNYDYKNFDLLLDVFIEKKYFTHFDLIVVGGEKEIDLRHKEKIKITAGQGNWLLHKFGNDKDLAVLYSQATVFVYPSLYEGFGLPPLEAMACGCPVLSSHSSSMPEVVGDAGLLFNPNDRNDFTSKLDKILYDKQLQLTLREKGKERAKQFTWQKSAQAMYEEYLKLEKRGKVT